MDSTKTKAKYRVTTGPSWAGYELWAGETLVEFGSLDSIIAYLADRDLGAEDCAILNDLRRKRAVKAAETKHLFGLTSEEFHNQRF